MVSRLRPLVETALSWSVLCFAFFFFCWVVAFAAVAVVVVVVGFSFFAALWRPRCGSGSLRS